MLQTIALLLGMRHGLDLDHITMIDSITRTIPPKKKIARFIGLLFSIGHGIVVTLFCILISIFIKGFTLPGWLNTIMAFFSIVLLIFFGSLNILSTTKIVSDRIFQQFKKLKIKTSTSILIVGAIFAISFDTLSQISLFSFNAFHQFSLLFSISLGLIFTTGMILTDGLNGYLTAFFLRKTNAFSLKLSKITGFLIGFLSTSVGIVELVKLL